MKISPTRQYLDAHPELDERSCAAQPAWVRRSLIATHSLRLAALSVPCSECGATPRDDCSRVFGSAEPDNLLASFTGWHFQRALDAWERDRRRCASVRELRVLRAAGPFIDAPVAEED